MWSGETTNIPSGWFLCDGQNGTPDLRNRFIVGAGNSYDVGDTGGSDSVTLSVTQMPKHTHNVDSSTSTTGKPTSQLGIWGGTGTASSDQGVFEAVLSRASRGNANVSTKPFSNWNHTHSLDGLVLGDTGSSQPHENRPPYYALAYIMKA